MLTHGVITWHEILFNPIRLAIHQQIFSLIFCYMYCTISKLYWSIAVYNVIMIPVVQPWIIAMRAMAWIWWSVDNNNYTFEWETKQWSCKRFRKKLSDQTLGKSGLTPQDTATQAHSNHLWIALAFAQWSHGCPCWNF